MNNFIVKKKIKKIWKFQKNYVLSLKRIYLFKNYIINTLSILFSYKMHIKRVVI